jgi:hypothetical protein
MTGRLSRNYMYLNVHYKWGKHLTASKNPKSTSYCRDRIFIWKPVSCACIIWLLKKIHLELWVMHGSMHWGFSLLRVSVLVMWHGVYLWDPVLQHCSVTYLQSSLCDHKCYLMKCILFKFFKQQTLSIIFKNLQLKDILIKGVKSSTIKGKEELENPCWISLIFWRHLGFWDLLPGFWKQNSVPLQIHCLISHSLLCSHWLIQF